MTKRIKIASESLVFESIRSIALTNTQNRMISIKKIMVLIHQIKRSYTLGLLTIDVISKRRLVIELIEYYSKTSTHRFILFNKKFSD